ncbi:hypothetical protein BJ165DRAFT_1509685 [Panaeolus papilionaceus]|nr:hypothetical protein BJ165DRAFT_1509685 [Panaeolus papilionaceus]
MRFHSNLIKFVTVDEPKLRLFQRLVKAREGKTMVFVTHRFGGLVKEADLVVCMTDGTIAEMGTHEELMKNDGEYAKLYYIQANVFAPGGVIGEGDATA